MMKIKNFGAKNGPVGRTRSAVKVRSGQKDASHLEGTQFR